jgi:hypothetical protein
MHPSKLPFLFLLFLTQSVVAQTDTLPPTLVCKTNLTVPILPICQITVSASDFIASVSDESQPIELGVRKRCTGTGFPSTNSLTYSVRELGIRWLEVWARDPFGNTSSCMMNVIVTDVMGSCDPGIFISSQTTLAVGIDSVDIIVKGSNCVQDTFELPIYVQNPPSYPPSAQGDFFQFGSISPDVGYEFSVTPSKNINPLNGVTSFDLTLISKHILGIEALDSPYKMIAADVNQDGKITTFDIVILRKLILGITNELPNGKSWRFLPDNYVFPNPQNPFMPAFPEQIEVPNTADPVPSDFRFKGVKIGDVNLSADPKF